MILVVMAGKFRKLVEPIRLAILRELMSAGQRNVGQVITATGGTLANISKHLKLLAKAGTVGRLDLSPGPLGRRTDMRSGQATR